MSIKIGECRIRNIQIAMKYRLVAKIYRHRLTLLLHVWCMAVAVFTIASKKFLVTIQTHTNRNTLKSNNHIARIISALMNNERKVKDNAKNWVILGSARCL